MRKGIIIALALIGILTISGCNKEEQPKVQASKTQVSSVNSISEENSKESTQVSETSKPGLFEREEQSLSPVTSDNVVDMSGSATSEQMEEVDKSDADEKPYDNGDTTRAQEFLNKIKSAKKYVFTCGEIKITKNGSDYYIDKDDVLKLKGKTYIGGKESEENYDDKLADAYANLYNFGKDKLTKSVVGYELYKIDDKVYKVTFRENGMSIICGDEQVDMDLREPDADDLKVLRLRGD